MSRRILRIVSLLFLFLTWTAINTHSAGALGNDPKAPPTGTGQTTPPTDHPASLIAPPAPKPADSATNATAKGDASSTPEAIPKIDSIAPAAPLIAPNQPIALTGSGFSQDDVITFTDPEGNSYPGTVETATDGKPDSGHLVVLATLGIAGNWKVTAKNKDGKVSNELAFAVANAHVIDGNSPAIFAFFACAGVSTLLLIISSIYLIVAFNRAQNAGWSLGDALSEESEYQPKIINTKSDVIMIASTSRAIALVGLMGILSIVVGMGYSIIWNLTIFGTVPDLSEVRSFLYGAACLFAPYLANQLSSVFTGSSSKKTIADNPAVPGVTGIAPASLRASNATQPLHVIGSAFGAGSTLNLTDPTGGTHAVAAADISSVAANLISANVTLDTPGMWKVAVSNPTATTAPFTFTVSGPPTITAVVQSPIPSSTAPQPITFTGSGFQSGLTVQLTPPGNPPVTVTPDTVTSQQVKLTAVVNSAGQWTVTITNPGNFPSSLQFPVS